MDFWREGRVAPMRPGRPSLAQGVLVVDKVRSCMFTLPRCSRSMIDWPSRLLAALRLPGSCLLLLSWPWMGI